MREGLDEMAIPELWMQPPHTTDYHRQCPSTCRSQVWWCIACPGVHNPPPKPAPTCVKDVVDCALLVIILAGAFHLEPLIRAKHL